MDFSQFDLPIVDVLTNVKDTLAIENTLIVSAPPGAGKSTLLPLSLLDSQWLNGKKILMLEPRRLAVKTIAQRMSDLLKDKLGGKIGYRIRFETLVSERTKLEVVTEGILVRMLQNDNALDDIGLIIFDEFHERSIHADVSLALTRECQKILRNDLRIMIMSATLNIEGLTEKLNCPVVESKGRQFPIKTIYLDHQDQMLIAESTVFAIKKALIAQDGDLLVFLPGQGEIKKCEELLQGKVGNTIIHPLFGQLPFQKQFVAIKPDLEGRRKIVLATAIAETSLTIEGIRVVVDSGFGRVAKFDHNSGLSRLETIHISKDSADQRSGRAGRLGPGVSYRLWSKATDLRLPSYRTPEIMEADLCSLALDLASWGVSDPYSLDWITPPPKGALLSARETLTQLEALNGNKVTLHGKKMSALPCHPRIAHMLLEAEKLDLVGLASDIAALIEERDPLSNEAGIDINDRIEALRAFRKGRRENRKWARIEKIAASYRKLFRTDEDNAPVDAFETGLLLAQAYPERIACARPGNNAQFQLANGKIGMAGHKDDLAYESWLAIANMNAREGVGKIFLASPLNPKDLAPMVKTKRIVKWDFDQGKLISSLDLRIGSIILKTSALTDIKEEEIADAIINAIKKQGKNLLDWSPSIVNFQNRIISLTTWRQNESWPNISMVYLIETSEEWLKPYISNVRNQSDLKKIDLKQIISRHFFTFDQLKLVDKLVPAEIVVPSGSKIQLQYSQHAEKPILAARIQELFGQENTPRVNNNGIEVLVHLLSPGFKPVQVTTDLSSFWSNTYFEVKKELKGRYPKHFWPDDPLNAEAVNGVKRRRT